MRTSIKKEDYVYFMHKTICQLAEELHLLVNVGDVKRGLQFTLSNGHGTTYCTLHFRNQKGYAVRTEFESKANEIPEKARLFYEWCVKNNYIFMDTTADTYYTSPNGKSHAFAPTFKCDCDERGSELVLTEAGRLLLVNLLKSVVGDFSYCNE